MEQTARTRSFTIIEAPSILGLKPGGVETLPQRLLELGRRGASGRAWVRGSSRSPTQARAIPRR
jgi:hypothetical protein